MRAWHIWLRNAARTLGAARLVRWRAHRTAARYSQEYHRDHPSHVQVGAGRCASRFLAGDEQEYINLRHKAQDRDILSAMVNALPEGGVCWDVGANIGVYSVIAARAVGPAGRVLAFEPEPTSRQRLAANVQCNNLGNVEIAPVALGAQEGSLRMLQGGTPSAGDHRLLQAGEQAPSGRVVEVPVVAGDAYREQRSLPVPALIKVDVEGAELDVLRGLLDTLQSPDCTAVICEVHFSILRSRGQDDAPLEIQRLLANCGFDRTRWIDRSHLAAFKIR